MTDKLKCPFCGAELKKEMAGDIETGRLVCCTKNCPGIDQNLFPDVWELLTTGKKAQDALKVARNLYQELALAHCEMVDDYRTTYGCLKTPEQETQEYMQEYDEKIISITK